MNRHAGPPPSGPTSEQPSPTSARAKRVLDGDDIRRTTLRLAHELLEHDADVSDLVLMGIRTRGVPLAHRLAATIAEVAGVDVPTGELDVTLYRDDLSRRAPLPLGQTTFPCDVDGRVVVLVDDVLYTGRTVRAALEAVTEVGRPRAVRVVVLVDRGHRELPIRADHVGKNLPTARGEAVRVRLRELDGEDAVEIVPDDQGGSR